MKTKRWELRLRVCQLRESESDAASLKTSEKPVTATIEPDQSSLPSLARKCKRERGTALNRTPDLDFQANTVY